MRQGGFASALERHSKLWRKAELGEKTVSGGSSPETRGTRLGLGFEGSPGVVGGVGVGAEPGVGVELGSGVCLGLAAG